MANVMTIRQTAELRELLVTFLMEHGENITDLSEQLGGKYRTSLRSIMRAVSFFAYPTANYPNSSSRITLHLTTLQCQAAILSNAQQLLTDNSDQQVLGALAEIVETVPDLYQLDLFLSQRYSTK